MKQNVQAYAKQLIKSNGGPTALAISVDCYKATRIPMQDLGEILKAKDPRVQRRTQKGMEKTCEFWDHVFGVVLKAVKPGVSRKGFLKGESSEAAKVQ